MKRIIVAASEKFSDIRAVTTEIGKYLLKYKLRGKDAPKPLPDVVLVTNRNNKKLRDHCAMLAAIGIQLHHESLTAKTAEGTRDKLCKNASGAIIFWDGTSKGTQKLIDKIERLEIPFIVHLYEA